MATKPAQTHQYKPLAAQKIVTAKNPRSMPSNNETNLFDSIKAAPKIIMSMLNSSKPALVEGIKVAPRITVGAPQKLGIPRWMQTNVS